MPPPAEIPIQHQRTRRKQRPDPLRRKPAETPPRSLRLRKALNLLLLFVTVVLVVDALVGEKGFMETLRARREWAALADSVERLERENAMMREMARRLREDPAAIEEIARQELGLVRPGEVLFILKDAQPSSK